MSIRNSILWGEDFLRTKKYAKRELKNIKDPRFREVAETFPLTKENKEAIDDFYMTNYGEKIPYIWHQYFSAHSGVFNPQYFPNLLLHPYFEFFINMNRHYAFVFEDKNVLPFIGSLG